MTKLLHIIASPRGKNSHSNALASAYIEARHTTQPGLIVDTLNLWTELLPLPTLEPWQHKDDCFIGNCIHRIVKSDMD